MNTSKDSRLAVVYYGAKFISSLLNDQNLLNSLPKNVLYTSLRQMSLKEHSLTFEFYLTSPIKLDKISLKYVEHFMANSGRSSIKPHRVSICEECYGQYSVQTLMVKQDVFSDVFPHCSMMRTC